MWKHCSFTATTGNKNVKCDAMKQNDVFKNTISANIKQKVDTSIKRKISGQSSTVVKGCIRMFHTVDTHFSY